jgi:hypothetical protein
MECEVSLPGNIAVSLWWGNMRYSFGGRIRSIILAGNFAVSLWWDICGILLMGGDMQHQFGRGICSAFTPACSLALLFFSYMR